ncbi:hypothetical protein HPG69_003506 [Diceros bicornis minor]|uniref:Linker for activation of T-cells family member 2 n=1 Tax=Diceros bicornis minor TaxID=77932 RepID=A0A7J7FAN6_DICBM|nr:hypothetical protein HPG69_003506 [Diceros bicornis minor]
MEGSGENLAMSPRAPGSNSWSGPGLTAPTVPHSNHTPATRLRLGFLSSDPITMNCYNWERFQKPPEDDDDANSYENVLICKQSTESGDEGSEDYQNSASIQQWQESRKVVEQVLREAPPSWAGSPDEDSGEPDYVNGDVAATQA